MGGQARHELTPTDPLVAAFIARNGVRRFEAGASGDPANLCMFLTDRGYEVAGVRAGRGYRVRAPGRGQRMKMLDLRALTALCDQVRRSEGLQPLRAS